MAKLPEPPWLLLKEARELVHKLTGEPMLKIERVLADAFLDMTVKTRGRCASVLGIDAQDKLKGYMWAGACIDWEKSEFSRDVSSLRTNYPRIETPDGKHEFKDVKASRIGILELLGEEAISEEREEVNTDGEGPDGKDGAFMRTGAAGRPSELKPLYLSEMRRRAKEGDLAGGVAAEAAYLLQWVVNEYPLAQQPTEKTIENAIRDEFRELKPKPA